MSNKFRDMFVHLNTVQALDRQTDWTSTDLLKQHRAPHALHANAR